jgi:hypothetical protein
VARHETDDGLGKVDIEIVADDIPPDIRGAKSFSVRVLPITPSTLPVATSKAAIRVCVPWRRYSNSRRSTLPGTIGSPGAIRSRAWMPVISSMEIVRWASSEVAAAL